MSVYYITTFYHFFPLKAQGKEAEQVKEELKKLAVEFSIHGLIITGSEGFNATISAMSSENLQAFKEALMKHFHIQIKTFKDSTSHIKPFRRFSVKIREEIVTTGIPGRVPEEFKNFHLSPEEWDQVIKKENDYVMSPNSIKPPGNDHSALQRSTARRAKSTSPGARDTKQQAEGTGLW